MDDKNDFNMGNTIVSVGVRVDVFRLSVKNSGISGTIEMAALKNVSVCGKKPLTKLN